MLLWSSVILIGIAVFIVTNTIFIDEGQQRASEQIEDAAGKQDVSQHGIILKYSRPFFRRYVTPMVKSMKQKKETKEKYKQRLANAGLSSVMTPEDFYAFKLFLILGFPIMFLVLRTFLEETWPLSLVPVMSLVGYFYPDLWVSGKIEQRKKDLIGAMPFAVDMLALSVEAGLDFIAAMGKVVEKAKKSALSEEFETVIKEIKIGASRAEALRNMIYRTDVIQVSSFCATLIAADSVGASIGPILKALSVEIRQKRSSEVEKAGATAATKILFPMLFLIVPAVLLIVMAPVALQFLTAQKGGN